MVFELIPCKDAIVMRCIMIHKESCCMCASATCLIAFCCTTKGLENLHADHNYACWVPCHAMLCPWVADAKRHARQCHASMPCVLMRIHVMCLHACIHLFRSARSASHCMPCKPVIPAEKMVRGSAALGMHTFYVHVLCLLSRQEAAQSALPHRHPTHLHSEDHSRLHQRWVRLVGSTED